MVNVSSGQFWRQENLESHLYAVFGGLRPVLYIFLQPQ
jgi:hypothetical protein